MNRESALDRAVMDDFTRVPPPHTLLILIQSNQVLLFIIYSTTSEVVAYI